ncbi:helix-turn-helix domain-containing protein [Dactylosporangium sp. NPDC048998]|uniref:helix-turn-helix domain-containing protein n=1 Tax=Dactylosporangium sp. NPDC048998 TaxID=3363976 RepID=UPI003713958B
MKWNLRWAAAQRGIWRPSDLRKAFLEVGFDASLSKVAALWSGQPISVRLDDLDRICAALQCTVGDLLEAEPLADAAAPLGEPARAADGTTPAGERMRPVPRRRAGHGRLLPPS